MLQESGVTGALHVRELVDLFRAYYPNPMSTADALALAVGAGQVERLGIARAFARRPQRDRSSASAYIDVGLYISMNISALLTSSMSSPT